MKLHCIALILALFLVVGCAVQEPIAPEETVEEVETVEIESDVDSVEETTDEVVVEETPVSGELPNEISAIIKKGASRLSSYDYNYRGPESGQLFSVTVKGSKMRIILPETNVEEQGKFYNYIYLDTDAKTAKAHCVGHSKCGGVVGEIKDLVYATAYLDTPLDWLAQVTSAEKIEERQVEGRDTLILETNVGTVALEEYYGFVYRIDSDDNTWVFSDASFNSVKDSEVTP